MSGQYPQGWQQPVGVTDPYGVQPTQPIPPSTPSAQWAASPAPQPGVAVTPMYPVAPGYAPGPYVVAPAAPRMNTLALVGFILSLVGVPVAPIVMGHIARKQIRTTGEAGDGLALAAMIIGYIAAGILAAVLIFYVVMMVLMLGVFSAVATTST